MPMIGSRLSLSSPLAGEGLVERFIDNLYVITYTTSIRTWSREIRVYKTADGREPFTKWMAALKNEKVRRAVLMRVDRLSLGNPGDWRAIKTSGAEGLREMRLQLEGGYRLFLAEDGPVIIVLLCGGSKTTQNRDIHRAVEYLNDYRSRK